MKKNFKIYKQQIISHTNLTVSETEKYINNAKKKISKGEFSNGKFPCDEMKQ